VPHKILVGVAEDVVVFGAVLREIERRVLEDGDKVAEFLDLIRAVAEFVGAAQSRADRLREIERSRNVALHTNAKMLRLKFDPAKAVPAMISYQYDENADPEAFYEGRTWPTEDGFAYIICHDCGELDEQGQLFEKNTVYSTRGDFTAHPDERCNVCKGYGFLRVGL